MNLMASMFVKLLFVRVVLYPI